jgi:hypothetical protein
MNGMSPPPSQLTHIPERISRSARAAALAASSFAIGSDPAILDERPTLLLI